MQTNNFSFFRGYSDIYPTDITLEKIVNLILHDPVIRDHTEKYRYYCQQMDLANAMRAKSGTPCFAVSVHFTGGKKSEHIDRWTHLCMADFDKLPAEQIPSLMELLKNDPHTLLAYVTISGKGLRVLYYTDNRFEINSPRINQKLHARLFQAGNAYYTELLGVPADLQCKNQTRLSGLSHDPDCYFNPAAIPFDIPVGPAASAENPSGNTTGLFKKALRKIRSQLTRQGAVYAPGSHNDYIMRMAYLFNQFGIPEEEATTWAVKQFTDYDGDIPAIFRSCYQNKEEHGIRSTATNSPSNSYYASVHEIEEFLRQQPAMRHNQVTHKSEYLHPTSSAWLELDDRYLTTLWASLCKNVKPARLQDLRHVLTSNFVVDYDPFRDYFESLPSWDGTTDYISLLASTVSVRTVGESDPITFEYALRKWLVALVASLLDPETVNHEILVLVGPQGSYKTTWFNQLLPPELQRYFYTKSDNGILNKDDMLTMSEFAIICLEELEELRPAELSRLKAMVTMKHVNERAAYSHYKERRTHIASFCGTSNHVHFLTDSSGNRRWLPFEVEHITIGTTPWPYEGIYSQAYALWKSGFKYWFTTQEIRLLEQHNHHFEVPDPECELIQHLFRRPYPGEACIFATATYILSRISSFVRNPLSLARISRAMTRLGYPQVRTSQKRGYHVFEFSAEQIRVNLKNWGEPPLD